MPHLYFIRLIFCLLVFVVCSTLAQGRAHSNSAGLYDLATFLNYSGLGNKIDEKIEQFKQDGRFELLKKRHGLE